MSPRYLMAEQTNIFQHHANDADYAMLCSALYEQQLLLLANTKLPLSLLTRRLSGLSYHIQRAARCMLSHQGPLALDLHNGHWQHKQTKMPPKPRYSAEQQNHWFFHQARIGMTIAVFVQSTSEHYYELDSIDRIEPSKNTIHLNKHGWFDFNGVALSPKTKLSDISLLKPQKSYLTAACCGYRWSANGPLSPRRLSIRELLLSLQIQW